MHWKHKYSSLQFSNSVDLIFAFDWSNVHMNHKNKAQNDKFRITNGFSDIQHTQ